MTGPTKTFRMTTIDRGLKTTSTLSITRYGRYTIDGVMQPAWFTEAIDAIIFSGAAIRGLTLSYFLDLFLGGVTNLEQCKTIDRWVRANFTYK